MDHLYDMLKLAKIVKIGINILKISVNFACCILTKQLRRHHTYIAIIIVLIFVMSPRF